MELSEQVKTDKHTLTSVIGRAKMYYNRHTLFSILDYSGTLETGPSIDRRRQDDDNDDDDDDDNDDDVTGFVTST